MALSQFSTLVTEMTTGFVLHSELKMPPFNCEDSTQDLRQNGQETFLTVEIKTVCRQNKQLHQ
jgi:hypothetical protein